MIRNSEQPGFVAPYQTASPACSAPDVVASDQGGNCSQLITIRSFPQNVNYSILWCLFDNIYPYKLCHIK